MKKRLALLCGITLSTLTWADQTVYVQSLQATLLKQPRFGSPAVIKLPKGTPLTLLDSRGSWRLVSDSEHQGWLSRLVIATQPPLKKVSVLEQKESLQQNVRRRSSTVVTAGAARGLSSDDRARRSDKQFANYHALRQVEEQQQQVSLQDAMTFLAEGLQQ